MSVYDTDDWRGFVAAIRADPDDDLPRLVAADWLEEQGEHDRAEFVRCAVNGWVGTDRNQPAVDREYDLLRRHWRAWLPAAVTPLKRPDSWVSDYGYPAIVFQSARRRDSETPTVRALFTRGFASDVECDSVWWLAHGDAVLAREPVTAVTLTSWPAVWHAGDGAGWRVAGDPADVLLPFAPVRDHPRGQVAGALAARWPGVTFILPPEPEVRFGRFIRTEITRVTATADDAGVVFRAIPLRRPGPGFITGIF